MIRNKKSSLVVPLGCFFAGTAVGLLLSNPLLLAPFYKHQTSRMSIVQQTSSTNKHVQEEEVPTNLLSSSSSGHQVKTMVTTVEQARTNLADALLQVWELDKDQELFGTSSRPPGGKTAGRYLLDLFIQEVSDQIKQQQQQQGKHFLNCLDWGNTYLPQFKESCSFNYNFRYNERQSQFIRATENRMGLVQGDLGEDMSHVPTGLFDLILCTQVLEHVPHWWKTLPNLANIIQENGVLLISVPAAFAFHPVPGDFWRFMIMGILHALESVGLTPCVVVSNGWRAYQMQAFALEIKDIRGRHESLLRRPFDDASLLMGAGSYSVVAQKQSECSPELLNLQLTNTISTEKIKAYSKGFWPEPMQNFPFGS